MVTGVQFHHATSRNDFPGRCVNISRGGLMMYVPAATPIQSGHTVRLSVGSVHRPEFAPLSEQPIEATVVRVDRRALLTSGHLGVGVKFAEA